MKKKILRIVLACTLYVPVWVFFMVLGLASGLFFTLISFYSYLQFHIAEGQEWELDSMKEDYEDDFSMTKETFMLPFTKIKNFLKRGKL